MTAADWDKVASGVEGYLELLASTVEELTLNYNDYQTTYRKLQKGDSLLNTNKRPEQALGLNLKYHGLDEIEGTGSDIQSNFEFAYKRTAPLYALLGKVQDKQILAECKRAKIVERIAMMAANAKGPKAKLYREDAVRACLEFCAINDKYKGSWDALVYNFENKFYTDPSEYNSPRVYVLNCVGYHPHFVYPRFKDLEKFAKGLKAHLDKWIKK